MSDILATINTRTTPQSQKADPRQVLNSAGGYVFSIDDEARLRRFLTIGSQGGTYYVSAKNLTFDNFDVLKRFADSDPRRLVDVIVDISTRGAAPKQNPALFALAFAAAHGDRAYALDALPKVARTGTHLFLFAGYVEQFRGWGRGLRRAVANWYLDKDADQVAYQTVKYRQREGWTHRDLLRLAHPKSDDVMLNAAFKWIVDGSTGDDTPGLIGAFLTAQENPENLPSLIRDSALSWEMLPDEALERFHVWDALLDKGMPQTALMRQLPRLTRLGLLPPMGGRTSAVAAQLADSERLVRGRVHPMNVLVAMRTYAGGRSLRGSSTWTPTAKIVDALDAAFYASYGSVTPSGKRTLLALDVSGSMGWGDIAGLPLTPREASAALSLVTAATEPQTQIVGFTSGTGRSTWDRGTGLTPLSISPRQRLTDAVKAVSDLPFGGTDCALPLTWGLKNKVEFDTVVVVTDNETWASRDGHVHQKLVEYRQKMGIDTKMIVCGMTATECTITDPSDAGSLDIVGFDTATPQVIADFSRGL